MKRQDKNCFIGIVILGKVNNGSTGNKNGARGEYRLNSNLCRKSGCMRCGHTQLNNKINLLKNNKFKKGKMQNLSLFVCDTLVLQRCSVLEQFIRYDELIVRFFPKRIVVHASRIAGTLDDIYLAVGYGRIVLGRIRQQVERIRAVERVNIVIGVILIAFPHEKTVFSPTARPRRVNPEQNIVVGTLVLKQIHLMIVR